MCYSKALFHVRKIRKYNQISNYNKNLYFQEEFEKEMSFILLQVMNGLKYLQAQGVELVNSNLDRFLLAKADNDPNFR